MSRATGTTTFDESQNCGQTSSTEEPSTSSHVCPPRKEARVFTEMSSESDTIYITQIIKLQKLAEIKEDIKEMKALRPLMKNLNGRPELCHPPSEIEGLEVKFPIVQSNTVAAHGQVQLLQREENVLYAAEKNTDRLITNLKTYLRGNWRELSTQDFTEAVKSLIKMSNELAIMCKDIKLRKTVLQNCAQVITISGQFHMLRRVKRTMFAAGTDEDRQGREILQTSLENLKEAIRNLVLSCEIASVKIQTDCGMHATWARKTSWLQD